MGWDERFEVANHLFRKGLYHAALELWGQLLQEPCDDKDRLAGLYDQIGQVNLAIAEFQPALDAFTRAVENAVKLDTKVLYSVHLTIANRHLAEFDKAQRSLSRLVAQYANDVSAIQRAKLYANLSALQGINEHYKDGLANCLKAYDAFREAGPEVFEQVKAPIHNNLGLLYLDNGRLDEAEDHLIEALKLDDNLLQPVLELSNLYIKKQEWAKSVKFAKMALEKVWSSIINYEKDEIARLCQILAELSYDLGERDIALRLIEKSELYFGQLGMWTEWQEAENTMSQWMESDETPEIDEDVDMLSYEQIGQFLSLLDAMNAQELVHEHTSILLDMRVHYVQRLAEALGKTSEEIEALIYASRFADYGLTALEPEVVREPKRSEQAWAKFQEHVSLSVQMVQTLHIPERIISIIADHHEWFGGGGFPYAKRGGEIDPLSSILAVADAYALGLIHFEKKHSEVYEFIRMNRGVRFHPDVVDAYLSLFDIES